MRRAFALGLAITVVGLVHGVTGSATPGSIGQNDPAVKTIRSCFLLHEIGVGEVRRSPAENCSVRLSPMSTFKIPHALAGLDAGVLDGAESTFRYDGAQVPFPAWAHDQTLRSAMRHSVLWYFQRLAERLGPEREAEYLRKFDYGNRDSTSALTAFWLGGSLAISPEEQVRFLLRLYGNDLPASPKSMDIVRQILIQPRGVITNATGEHPFAAPWPDDLVLSAKTGSGDFGTGAHVRWIVGHARRGTRTWIFVSCVSGTGAISPLAAVDLAASSLRAARVW